MLEAAKTAGWIAAFVFVLAFLGLMAMQASQNPPKQQEQNTQRPDSQKSEENPNKAKEHKNDEGNNWSYYKKQIKEYWDCLIDFADRRHDAIIAIGTVFIALFTIVLAFATGFLWLATKNLVTGADETAERQLRAYVFVSPDTTELRPDGKAISIKYKIENTGRTPAYKVRHSAEIRLLPFPLPNDTVIESPSDFVGGMSLGNGVPMLGERQQEVDVANVAPNLAFYIIVIVKYEDAFKKMRTVRMCAGADIGGAYRDYLARKVKDPAAQGQGPFTWYYPAQHNDSD